MPTTQCRTHQVNVRRIQSHLVRRHEAEMIIPVRRLRLAAWAHLVDLCCNLIPWSQPGPAGDVDDRVGHISHIHVGRTQTQLLQAVPDAVVGSSLGEIAGGDAGCALVFDDLLKDFCCRIDRRKVLECVPDDEHTRPLPQNSSLFALDTLVHPVAVVDRDVRNDFGRGWAGRGLNFHLGTKIIQPNSHFSESLGCARGACQKTAPGGL